MKNLPSKKSLKVFRVGFIIVHFSRKTLQTPVRIMFTPGKDENTGEGKYRREDQSYDNAGKRPP